MIEQGMEGILPTDNRPASDIDTRLILALLQSLRANLAARARLRAAASGR